eukprot:g1386.t1
MAAAVPNNNSLLVHNMQMAKNRKYGNKVTVINEASTACPAPLRTKYNRCTETAKKKSSSRPVTTLTRPTVSSLAKTREKVSNSKKETKSFKRPDKNKKSNKNNTSSIGKHNVESIVPIRPPDHLNTNLSLCQKATNNLTPDTNLQVDGENVIEVNPFLLAAGDMVFKPFSEQFDTASSTSTILSYPDLESCDNENKSTLFASLPNLPRSCVYAISFAAGFGVGLALGVCTFLSCGRTA